jgi:hypothetical protein
VLLNCQDTPRLASGYIGRELPVRLRLAVGLHLTVCRACRAYLRGLRRTQDLARASLREAPPPDDLLRRLGLGVQDDARDLGERERSAVPPPEERDHDDPPDLHQDLPRDVPRPASGSGRAAQADPSADPGQERPEPPD